MRVRTKKRRRFSWYLIWFTIFFFFAGVLLSLVLSLPVWRITSFAVLGARIVAKPYIETFAAPLIGENIFLVDYSKLKAKIKSIAQIKDFGIWRSLPSTLVIKVVERSPFCVVTISGSSIVIDDEGGFLKVEGGRIKTGDYSFVKVDDISQFPVVRGIDPNKVSGGRLERGLSAAIKISINRLSRFFPPSNLQFEIRKDGGLDVLIEDILKVRFGSTDDLEKKISVLEAMLPRVSGAWSNVDYMDIRVAEDPVVKYKTKP